MNKVIITMISVVIIISCIIFGTVMYRNQVASKGNNNNDEYQTTKVGEINNNEEIYDECTEEFEKTENVNLTDTMQANSGDIKISPNGMFILKKKYTKCDHLINEYLDIPTELVNKTETDLKNQYKDWEIQEFLSNKIILYRKYNEECGQHYVLRDRNGKLIINKINKEGKEEEYQETEIATGYLPETDKSNLEKGLKVYGKEELNQILEDFE